jgi:hypothetical protein
LSAGDKIVVKTPGGGGFGWVWFYAFLEKSLAKNFWIFLT